MSELIQLANKYAKVSCYGWTVTPKPKEGRRENLVRKNGKAVWAKGGLRHEEIASGDLLARMYEETDKDVASGRYPDQEDFKRAEKRMGNAMSSSEFIKKVLSLNGNLIYEDSVWNKGCGAFYIIRRGEKFYTGACFKLGWIPEWTTMKTDTADLPTRDGLTLGWRTPLQRLVQKRIISMKQVQEVFGLVTHGDVRGKTWAIATQHFN